MSRRASQSVLHTAARTAGIGASAAATTSFFALWGSKVVAPPEDGGSGGWWKRHTRRAEASSAIASAEITGLSTLGAAGLSADELRAGIGRWTGIELLAEREVSAARGADALRAVIDRLRATGLLSSEPELRPTPETRKTYGCDVGSAAPQYLGRPEESPRVASEEVDGILGCLREDGVAVVSSVVGEAEVRELRRRLKVLGSGGTCPSEVLGGEVLAAASGAAPPLTPSDGRRHFLVRGTNFAEDEVIPLLAPLLPLAYRYFAEERPDALPGALLSEASPSRHQRLFLSECQVLVSDPGAVQQIWHRDNRKPGLTFILPLTDVDDEVGPTQLLPGTHHLVSRGGAAAALSALGRSTGAVSGAPLKPGAVLIYDARTLHRGLGNSSYNRCRVVVVLRLDYADTPPPGESVPQTALARAAGALLHGAGVVYAALPAPARHSSP